MWLGPKQRHGIKLHQEVKDTRTGGTKGPLQASNAVALHASYLVVGDNLGKVIRKEYGEGCVH